jgi:cytoskeletal protein RodZ
MKTVGGILESARKKARVELTEVEAATKIKKNFLKAIERNDFQALPSRTAARGFVKNYAQFLELSPEPILAIFKRDFGVKKKEIFPRQVVRLGAGSRFNWTPRLTLVIITSLVFLSLLGYLGYQYFSLVKTPRLELIQPQENQLVEHPQVEVKGKSDSEAVVKINDQPILVSENGDFSFSLSLMPGRNKVMVEAVNKLGKRKTVERIVFYSDTER